MTNADGRFMHAALQEARQAEADGDVPVGAVIVQGTEVVGRGRNSMIRLQDPTAHAEILALREAARRLGNYRLPGCTLYVTMEPCAMCAGAAVLARIERLVYGCSDPKAGAVRSLFRITDDPRLNHCVEIELGILEQECAGLVQAFFRKKRGAPPGATEPGGG